MFKFCNRYVVTKLLEENRHACPMKELLPRRLKKKTSDAPAAVLTMVLALA